MIHIAVFVSGNGTNCENLIRHFRQSPKAQVTLVVSNRAEAKAVVRARNLGVATCILSKSELQSHAHALGMLQAHGIDVIVLAGFLLMVPSFLIEAYPRRIINIHPALLPKYGGKGMYGIHVHRAVKAAREHESGITVHHVSNECDGGEIIAQFRTSLSPNDTPDDIASKVHLLEMQHYPEIIEKLIDTWA